MSGPLTGRLPFCSSSATILAGKWPLLPRKFRRSPHLLDNEICSCPLPLEDTHNLGSVSSPVHCRIRSPRPSKHVTLSRIPRLLKPNPTFELLLESCHPRAMPLPLLQPAHPTKRRVRVGRTEWNPSLNLAITSGYDIGLGTRHPSWRTPKKPPKNLATVLRSLASSSAFGS